MTAAEIASLLDLAPHPEGGLFRETFRSAASTAIYYLLRAGETSHWHRIHSDELWHFYAGSPLTLSIAAEGSARREIALGNALNHVQHPQAIVAANAWQGARSEGDWTLVGCTVSPPFDFAHFELAPADFNP